MSDEDTISILIAEDNDVSREMMARVIRMQGAFRVYEAENGSTALNIVKSVKIHLAIVDQMMDPVGGFQFAQSVVAGNMEIPIIMVTAHDASDVLIEASKYGIQRVIQKPIAPVKLVDSVNRLLAQRGLDPKPIATYTLDTKYQPEDIMRKVLELAAQNKKYGKGGPFGAIVSDVDGKILGEGTSGAIGRSDPVAHAEVMAIRQASEKLGRTDLSDCLIYCSGEPTKIGKALIASVGIGKVFYGLRREEMESFLGKTKPEPDIEYVRLCSEDAFAMMETAMADKKETKIE